MDKNYIALIPAYKPGNFLLAAGILLCNTFVLEFIMNICGVHQMLAKIITRKRCQAPMVGSYQSYMRDCRRKAAMLPFWN